MYVWSFRGCNVKTTLPFGARGPFFFWVWAQKRNPFCPVPGFHFCLCPMFVCPVCHFLFRPTFFVLSQRLVLILSRFRFFFCPGPLSDGLRCPTVFKRGWILPPLVAALVNPAPTTSGIAGRGRGLGRSFPARLPVGFSANTVCAANRRALLKCCNSEHQCNMTETKENPLIPQPRPHFISFFQLLSSFPATAQHSPTTLLSILSQPFQGGRDFHTPKDVFHVVLTSSQGARQRSSTKSGSATVVSVLRIA